MQNDLNKKPNKIKQVLMAIVEPHPSVLAAGERRLVRLLIASSLIIAIVCALSLFLSLLVNGSSDPYNLAFYRAYIVTILLMIGTFTLARTPKYRQAAYLLVTFLSLITIAIVTMVQNPLSYTLLDFLVLSVLVSSFFLNVKQTLLLSITNLCLMLFLPHWAPHVTWLEIFNHPFIYNIFASSIIIAFRKYRDEIEHDNQAELIAERDQIAEAKALDDAILQSIGDGVIVVDTQNLVRLINRQALQVLHLKSMDIEGKPLKKIFPIFDSDNKPLSDRLLVDLEHSKKPGKQIHTWDLVYLRSPAGATAPLELSISPILQGGKKNVGAVIAFRDITNKLKAREEMQRRIDLESFLRHSSAQLISMDVRQALYSMISHLGELLKLHDIKIYEFDKSIETISNTIRWTSSCRTSCDIDKKHLQARDYPWIDQILDHKIVALPSIEARLENKFVNNLQKQQVKSLIVIPLSLGEQRYGFLQVVHYSISRSWDDETINTLQLACGIIAAALKRQEDDNFLREINEMKSEFVSVASHQLRTPLSAMHWLVELLKDDKYGKLSNDQADFVAQIDSSIKRLIQLVNDLLSLSRIENGKIKAQFEPTNIVEICEQLIYEMSKMAADKQLKIRLKKNSDKKIPLVLVDKIHIRQVMLNLISNAIKYTPRQGGITLDIIQKGDELEFQCQDTGLGIPKEQQNRVFSKFFRGDNIVKTSTDGTGLGLYISKALIESFGGRLWFTSEENNGSTFFFSLPILDHASKQKPNSTEQGKANMPDDSLVWSSPSANQYENTYSSLSK